MSEQEVAFHTEKNAAAIEGLELAVFGDGNGNKGLIRRVDGLEREVQFIKKQNWVIIAMLLGLYAQFIKALLVP